MGVWAVRLISVCLVCVSLPSVCVGAVHFGCAAVVCVCVGAVLLLCVLGLCICDVRLLCVFGPCHWAVGLLCVLSRAVGPCVFGPYLYCPLCVTCSMKYHKLIQILR